MASASAGASTRPSILVQLDTDPQPSVFDAVVAIDAGVDQLLRHGGVRPESVRDLVHGALFTRGLADLRRTAVFVGGSDVSASEAVLKAVRSTFFAGFRVSVLFDANGCNTTAAAAVLAVLRSLADRGIALNGATAAVLGTGPVGLRVARLLARQGAGSRSARARSIGPRPPPLRSRPCSKTSRSARSPRPHPRRCAPGSTTGRSSSPRARPG